MSWVYFIRREDDKGPVKIGCSKYPTERILALLRNSPCYLKILGTFRGDRTDERLIHDTLMPWHSHLEWFHWSSEVQTIVNGLMAGSVRLSDLRPISGSHRQNTRSRHSSLSHRLPRKLRELGREPSGKTFQAVTLNQQYHSKPPEYYADIEAFFEDPERHGQPISDLLAQRYAVESCGKRPWQEIEPVRSAAQPEAGQ